MFEKFQFSPKQIVNYFASANRDLKIARQSKVAEVAFRFSYDALLKLAIAVCAIEGLRVKARKGHHIALIGKLAKIIGDSEIEVLGNRMRAKRNWELYDGGMIISQKEVSEYLIWVVEVFKKAQNYADDKNRHLKLF